MCANLIKYFWETNWLKTLKINFHYFGFRDAVKLPIIISKGVTFQTFFLGGGEIKTSNRYAPFGFSIFGIPRFQL